MALLVAVVRSASRGTPPNWLSIDGSPRYLESRELGLLHRRPREIQCSFLAPVNRISGPRASRIVHRSYATSTPLSHVRSSNSCAFKATGLSDRLLNHETYCTVSCLLFHVALTRLTHVEFLRPETRLYRVKYTAFSFRYLFDNLYDHLDEVDRRYIRTLLPQTTMSLLLFCGRSSESDYCHRVAQKTCVASIKQNSIKTDNCLTHGTILVHFSSLQISRYLTQ